MSPRRELASSREGGREEREGGRQYPAVTREDKNTDMPISRETASNFADIIVTSN